MVTPYVNMGTGEKQRRESACGAIFSYNWCMVYVSICTKCLIAALFVSVIMMILPTPLYAIVGGEEAVAGEQNWMVAIALAQEDNGYYAQFCGGTLIDSKWILTAAHCTFNEGNVPFIPAELDVLVARTKLSSSAGLRVAVTQIIRHPAFNLTTYENDLALLQLSQNVEGEMIPLAVSHTAKVATVLGWGMTEQGTAADVLHEVTLPLVSQDGCQNAFREYGVTLNENVVCAGRSQGGADSCIGDSGGPLVQLDDRGKRVQVGVVSWGLECGAPGLFGVYTDVTRYGNWIAFQLAFNSQ